jgi:hypothetical protein
MSINLTVLDQVDDGDLKSGRVFGLRQSWVEYYGIFAFFSFLFIIKDLRSKYTGKT